MLRYTAWALAALYLLTVGLWPAAITPVTLTLAGLAAVIATIPPSVLILAAVIAWLKNRPTPTKATA